MFTCPACSQECKRLIIPPDGTKDRKLCCEGCYDRTEYRPTYLHQRFVDNNGIEGCKNLTVAKANVIGNRQVCREDRSVIVDKRTGKETQY